ncbi:MAG: His/Gly/Thr/Pro-type tRNA ligase C-terminal domain-containing protein, partial [Burkholderiaceae bacterium]
GTVCGGGRYDSLVEQMGGKPAPACGFAIGVERLIALLEEVAPVSPVPGVDVYLAHFGENSEPAALRAAEALRSQGLRVAMHSGAASIKSQMKKADGSGAWLAAIQGDDERQAGTMVLKALRGSDPSKAVQQTVSLAQAGMVAKQMIQEQRTHSGA